MICRFCGKRLIHEFIDLGCAPPSNAYRTAGDINRPEVYYPLKLRVCTNCWLVQTEDYAGAEELFSPDYAYFLIHIVKLVGTCPALLPSDYRASGFELKSFVVEIACNDGYLLKNFSEAGIPCLGIEPTASTAAAARNLSIPVLQDFFGEMLGRKLVDAGQKADLIIGNNVYAHVPDINDFTKGLKTLLKPGGTITLEFPHLMRLIEQNQFDTIYHEHFSYLSLYALGLIFEQAGLKVYDVEELPTHGGSLRAYGCHSDDAKQEMSGVKAVLEEERKHGLRELATYLDFQSSANKVKDDLLAFLIEQKRLGKTVAAYGAAAKGNTLLNYAGVKSDLIPFVSDAAPSKQGKFMPGSHIPILPPSALAENRPDWVLILPWNIAEEVVREQDGICKWGGRFVVSVPKLKFL